MRSVPLHLEPGSDVRRALEWLAAEENASGFVLGVVGNLSQAAFQCPGAPAPTLIQGELEIITLQGTLAPAGVHLHLSVSDPECQVWGGHIEPGTLVLKGADLLVGLLDGPLPTGAATLPASAAAELPALAARPPAVAPGAPPTGGSRVEIAVFPGCPYCARALRLLRTLTIPYRLVEPQAGSVPQVSIDGQLIGGYDALAELHSQGRLEGLRQG
ncbi:PCC domain-containing protein [Cyanobium sp. Morenito 9A2]|uniref:PCC domain-containing protein n=1 Tax=Cyanobium sp. Morenito 9A2 TaxID=2823718 RepID=UPI0020CFD60D|nr:DUF296 domain-containing protein [Cyanobium sp. Morenito 9A2]MCP9850804.1 DUF296 domain-containing protein [Cyanobium sp. Morenito 9A2]